MSVLAWLMSAALLQVPAAVEVTFRINDAFVKDKVLAGVGIGVAAAPDGDYVITGTTDTEGELRCALAPGRYFVTYRNDLYVPIERSPVEITGPGQVITTTLTMLMEAEGDETDHRRVAIVLNWGSDPSHARDLDSHLLCPCGDDDGHVYFANKTHADHGIELDVDDMDWGGPETITLVDPQPGEYVYWVHNFSGAPPALSDSAVVVRVLFGDRVAAEYPIPRTGFDGDWRPFKALVIDRLLEPALVEHSAEELAAGAQRDVPIESTPAGPFLIAVLVAILLLPAVVIAVVTVVVVKLNKRRRAA